MEGDMRKFPWLRIGAVAALWMVVGGAAVSGWMVGRSDAAREYSDLQRRLTVGEITTKPCGAEFELLDLRRDNGVAPPAQRRPEPGPTEISAPGYFHLRSLITAR
jgi:hypothetical protein